MKNFLAVFIFIFLSTSNFIHARSNQIDSTNSGSRSTSTHSSSIYVNFGFGYNLDNLSNPFYSSSSSGAGSLNSLSVKFNSYGKGFVYDCGVGIELNQNISAELNIKLLRGATLESKSSDYFQEWKGKASAIYFTPTLLINFPELSRAITPYSKLGMIIGIPEITTNNRYSDSYNSTSDLYEVEYRKAGGIALGYKMELGIKFIVNGNFDLLCGIDFTAMNYKPAKRTVTKYSHNGNDLTWQIINRDVDFKDSEDPNGSPSLLQESDSFSSIGMHLAVQYHF